MIPVHDLSAEDRDRLRESFATRMGNATSQEWRKFWETEVLFLDGRNTEAVTQLRELAEGVNQQAAVAALMSLGDWYEQSGSVALARKVYMRAIEKPDMAGPILAMVKLARLYNNAHEPARAVAVLQSAATTIENVPADTVQFVVTEYSKSLCDLGCVDDAREFIRHAITSFPDRAELPLLERHLLGATK